MYQKNFGKKNQVQFDSAADYYEFLGYLAKGDNTTKIVWEHNEEQGAWAEEGRILFYLSQPTALRARLNHTAGIGSIVSRVNCNDFVEHIKKHHHFIIGASQDPVKIKTTILTAHYADFDRGLTL